MRAEDFSFRLQAASFCAWRFASTMVKERLPHEFSYGVTLNASCDYDCKPDEKVYPEDDFRVIFDLDLKGVVSLLCRENRVPQWVDVSVSSCDRKKSYLHLICCGRYHSDEDRLYYHSQGSQPFGIKSPSLPKGSWPEDYDPKARFKLPSYKDFRKLELHRRDMNREAQQNAAFNP